MKPNRRDFLGAALLASAAAAISSPSMAADQMLDRLDLFEGGAGGKDGVKGWSTPAFDDEELEVTPRLRSDKEPPAQAFSRLHRVSPASGAFPYHPTFFRCNCTGGSRKSRSSIARLHRSV